MKAGGTMVIARTLLKRLAFAAGLAVVVFYTGNAQTPASGSASNPSNKVQRIPIPNSDFPISQGVLVPANSDTLYLSGSIPPVANPSAPKGSIQSYGDTEAQTVAVLQRIEQALEAQKLSLADIVMMHAYLVGDPGKDGKMDFTGFMAGYTRFFGTKEQPNKPARSAMQVAGLAAPGALVEIEVIAVRPR
jgi:enamine deaminase RidA (YjgF/YER057c/UK114 family)